MNLAAKIEAAAAIVETALRGYGRRTPIVLLVSGGRDSTTAAHVVRQAGYEIAGVAHVATGIGVPDTLEYVRDFASWMDLPLTVESGPRTFEDLVVQYGLPGPGAHRYMYSWLKERALRKVRAKFQSKRGARVIFVTGVRFSESQRRMGHVQTMHRDRSVVWIAPIADFEMADVMEYHRREHIPVNEVVANLHMSGECLCGSYAHPGEIEEIGFFYPAVAQRLRALEALARDAGQKHCVWGPDQYRPQGRRARRSASPGMLCRDCVQLALPLEAGEVQQ